MIAALAEILYIFYLAIAAKGKVGGDTDLSPFTVVGVPTDHRPSHHGIRLLEFPTALAKE